eukprot:2410336-Rhodomonas_salina.2
MPGTENVCCYQNAYEEGRPATHFLVALYPSLSTEAVGKIMEGEDDAEQEAAAAAAEEEGDDEGGALRDARY